MAPFTRLTTAPYPCVYVRCSFTQVRARASSLLWSSSPAREGHLAVCAIDLIAVHVDVEEGVVGPQFLQLLVGVEERAGVPQPDVVDREAVGGEVLLGQALAHGEGSGRHVGDTEGEPRGLDVLLDVLPLRLDLVRRDPVLLQHGRVDLPGHQPHHDQEAHRHDREPPAAVVDVQQEDGRRYQ